jgi:hypothetical protein
MGSIASPPHESTTVEQSLVLSCDPRVNRSDAGAAAGRCGNLLCVDRIARRSALALGGALSLHCHAPSLHCHAPRRRGTQ